MDVIAGNHVFARDLACIAGYHVLPRGWRLEIVACWTAETATTECVGANVARTVTVIFQPALRFSRFSSPLQPAVRAQFKVWIALSWMTDR